MSLQLTPAELAAYNARRPLSAHQSVCHAPSRSLYFGMRGEVMVCCTNRSHLAGRYPEQSIREIWEGAAVMEVREKLAKGDLSNGCKGCYELIKGGNYLNMPGRLYDAIPANPQGWPSRMDFELTNTCNLECVMCRGELSSAIRRNRDGLPPIPSAYGPEFVEELEEFIPHLSQSYFAGGEPFLINQYLEIWDRMAELNPGHQLSVQTNATILSDRIKKLLEQLRFSIAVSIDSVHADRLESIRVNAKWNMVHRNILYFRDYCRRKGTQLTISYTPMRLNWMELPDAIDFCNQLGVQIFFNNLSFPRHLAFSHMKAAELANVVDFLQNNLPQKTGSIEQSNCAAYLDLVGQIKYWWEQAQEKEGQKQLPVLQGEAYLNDLHSQILSLDSASSGLADEVTKKLRLVFREIESTGPNQGLWLHMATVEPKMLCTFIPGKSVDELLAAYRTALSGS